VTILPLSQPSPQVRYRAGSWVQITGLPAEHEAELKRTLTIANPEAVRRRRFSGWVDKSVPKVLTGYLDELGEGLAIAPGVAGALWTAGRRLGYQQTYEGPGAPSRRYEWQYSGDSRPEQATAVNLLHRRRHACLITPCGGGKTDMALQLICARGVRTLILVHTLDLKDQWCDRIEERMGFKPKALNSRPKKPLEDVPIIVATVQFLLRNADVLLELARHREMVLVDECDFAPRMTFEGVLSRLNPYWRHGFTATEERDDGLSPLMTWWIGPVVARIDREDLEASGRIMRPCLNVRALPDFVDSFRSDEPGEYGRMIKRLEACERRLSHVGTAVMGSWFMDRGFHLVLVSHVEYLDRLAKWMSEDAWHPDSRLASIIGPMTKPERREVLARSRSGEVDILFATSLADRGLDLPNLTHLWIVSPARAAPKVEQQIGRICRAMSGKAQPVVTVFVDTKVQGVRMDRETKDLRLSRTMVNQFKHRLRKVFRRVCDIDDQQIKEVLK
jgi:superfamily II DNA or RNA helicase